MDILAVQENTRHRVHSQSCVLTCLADETLCRDCTRPCRKQRFDMLRLGPMSRGLLAGRGPHTFCHWGSSART